MSLVALLTRTVISLAIVLAVIAIAYRIARRRSAGSRGARTSGGSGSANKNGLFGSRRRNQPAPIEVVGRVGLTRGTAAVAVRFGERIVLVSAADQAPSTVLAEMSSEDWDELNAVPEISTPMSPGPGRTRADGSNPTALADTTRPSFVEALRQATSRHE